MTLLTDEALQAKQFAVGIIDPSASYGVVQPQEAVFVGAEEQTATELLIDVPQRKVQACIPTPKVEVRESPALLFLPTWQGTSLLLES